MKNDMQHDELRALFAAHKGDISDDGFSQRVAEMLPHRLPITLPRSAVVAVGAVVTLAVAFFTYDGLFIDTIADLVAAACTQSAPAPTSLAVYGGLMALLGTVGFTACYESC